MPENRAGEDRYTENVLECVIRNGLEKNNYTPSSFSRSSAEIVPSSLTDASTSSNYFYSCEIA
ncbi:MAG: hypothetical protein K5744_06885 [Eubacterium sp.]|nr:hypothetical protein [Eubacterium sp.]